MENPVDYFKIIDSLSSSYNHVMIFIKLRLIWQGWKELTTHILTT